MDKYMQSTQVGLFKLSLFPQGGVGQIKAYTLLEGWSLKDVSNIHHHNTFEIWQAADKHKTYMYLNGCQNDANNPMKVFAKECHRN